MRKLLFFTSLLLLSTPLFAGVAYHFTLKTTGLSEAMISGRIEAEGMHTRMDIEHGDAMLFKDNSIVISNDGGQTMSVFDPATKTFYVLKLSDFVNGPLASMKSLGASLKFSDPKTTTHDAGDGGTIEGYPTRHMILDLDYDLVASVLGTTVATHIKTHSEMWRTDKINSVMTPFQVKAVHTGIDALDKLIAAYDATGKGLALREVTTVETKQGANTTKTTSTSTVTHVEQRAIPAAELAMPSGYKQVPNPIDTMLGSIKE